MPGDTDVDEVEIVLCIAESFVRVNYNSKERRLQRVESERSSGQMCGELCGSRCLDGSVFVSSYHIKKRGLPISADLSFFSVPEVYVGVDLMFDYFLAGSSAGTTSITSTS